MRVAAAKTPTSGRYPHMQGLKLTTSQIQSALPRVSVGLAKYVWLQRELPVRDVSDDVDYQKRFAGFYRVRRNSQWRLAYFLILERAKSAPVSFAEALRALHATTGRVEASFASKLVATVDPDQPVIDSVVLRNLGLRLPAAAASNRFAQLCDLHNRLGELYSAYLVSDAGRDLVALFRVAYPASQVTDIKILDLVLWQSRGTV